MLKECGTGEKSWDFSAGLRGADKSNSGADKSDLGAGRLWRSNSKIQLSQNSRPSTESLSHPEPSSTSSPSGLHRARFFFLHHLWSCLFSKERWTQVRVSSKCIFGAVFGPGSPDSYLCVLACSTRRIPERLPVSNTAVSCFPPYLERAEPLPCIIVILNGIFLLSWLKE